MRRSRILATLLAAGAMGLGGVGTASAAVTTPQAQCGFFTSRGEAYYLHCGSTGVEIAVELWVSPFPVGVCVPPGQTNLGDDWVVAGAYFTGPCK